MEQVLDFFRKLFDTADWPPRWHCGNWTDFHGWLYIISDLLIWSAYFAIPLAILRVVSNRVDPRFMRTYLLFAAFILACGSTHLLDAITFWFPAYRLNALVRFITGVVSWVTVFHLVKLLPLALSLPSHAELEKEIAERRRVEQELQVSNQQLNVAQEIAKVGHWEWNVKEDRLTWSRELHKIFGVPEGTPLNYNLYLGCIHPDDRAFVERTVQEAFEHGAMPPFTHRIRLADGTERIIQGRGEVETNGGGERVRMIGIAQDVTEQQRAQQQLVERSNELESMNAELQKFAYVASHDLKEPLRKILTFSSLLNRDVDDKVTDNGRLYMQKITQAAERMQRLIDDILQFSSLRGDKETFRPVDLDAVLRQVMSDLEVKIENAGARITASNLPTLDAIPTQMGQLFQNLVSNALKFGREGVPPEVQVRCRVVDAETAVREGWTLPQPSVEGGRHHLQAQRYAEITVQDNGIGFDPEYTGKIFEIFQRLHGARVYEGTGIGLAIVKKIVDNHHGAVRADSRPGEGARFTVLLPLSQTNPSTE